MAKKSGRTGQGSDATAVAQQGIHDKVMNAEQRLVQHGEGRLEQNSVQQTGTRNQPAPPLPKQHLEKPGLESDLVPRPHYLATDYKGSEKLKDCVALITGGDSGIGRAVAVLFAREGADIAIAYLNEHSDAQETRTRWSTKGGVA